MRSRGHLAGWALAASSLALAGGLAEAGETVTYSYDALGRLTATNIPGRPGRALPTGASNMIPTAI
jgi:YD repeat-containing protein